MGGRIKRVLARRGGFTLIELIVTLALLTMISGGVAMLIEPSARIFMESTNLSRGKRIADNVANLIAGELGYATDLVLGDESWGSDSGVTGAKTATYKSPIYGKMALNQTNGIVTMELVEQSGQIGYGEEYYMGNTARVGLEMQSPELLRLTVEVYDRSDARIARRERYVRLLNTPAVPPPQSPP